MERVFTIRTRSNRNPRSQYPSERRYSASIVTGLSMVYFQLCLYSIVMGSLIIHKINNTNNETNIELARKIENILDSEAQFYSNIPGLTCVGCFLMCIGFFSAFISGIFAWKKWYIDHNITFFFLANTLSMITSSLSLTISLVTLLNFELDDLNTAFKVQIYPITLGLALNIFILSFIGVVWSILASKVAYRGMRTRYPDDINYAVGGRRIEVNVIKKGNLKINIYPPDIISHFPANDKLAKYLPKKDTSNTSNLPKLESNTEYQQRVNNFLAGENVVDSNQV